MLQHEEPLARSYLARALGVPEAQLALPVALPDGYTNSSYLGSWAGKQYIIRLPRKEKQVQMDRYNEYAVYQQILPLGISDEMLFFDPEAGVKVSIFVENARSVDPDDPDDVRMAMALLRRLHALTATARVGNMLDDALMYQRGWTPGYRSRFPDHAQVMQRVLALRSWLFDPSVKLVLNHGDTYPGNYLVYYENGEKKLRLVDWESANLCDPLVDVAMFAMTSAYRPAQTDELVRVYDPALGPEARRRVYGWVAAIAMMWSNWGEYELCCGADFGDEVTHYIEMAREYLDILDRMEETR